MRTLMLALTTLFPAPEGATGDVAANAPTMTIVEVGRAAITAELKRVPTDLTVGQRERIREGSRRDDRRERRIAGIALIAAGTVMTVFNLKGLGWEDDRMPYDTGGARDGYLGKPGVVIGVGLVTLGGFILFKDVPQA